MKRLVVSVVLLAAVLVGGVAPSLAAGDTDGVWRVTQGSGASEFQYFATIHQNDALQGTLDFNLMIGLMDPEFGTWRYATATRSGQAAQGPVFDGFEALETHHVANINITFTNPTTFSGTITEGGVDTPISGLKVF